MKQLLLAVAALSLGSCTVYAPTQCAAPNIRDRGELEVAATLHANTKLEGALTYSPIKHVLVRAAGGFRNGFSGDTSTSNTYFRVRQYEVAAGGYWCPTERLVLGGLGGYGQAHNQRGFVENGLAYDNPFRNYDARYHTIFGEAFAVFQGRYVGAGGALRLTGVQFDQLTNRGNPIGPESMLRAEPMGFVRFDPTAKAGHFLQLQVAAGLSWTADNGLRGDSNAENVRDANLRVAASLLLYPHQLWRK